MAAFGWTLTDVTRGRRVVTGHGFDVTGDAAQRVGDGALHVGVAVVLVVRAERIVHPLFGACFSRGVWRRKVRLEPL